MVSLNQSFPTHTSVSNSVFWYHAIMETRLSQRKNKVKHGKKKKKPPHKIPKQRLPKKPSFWPFCSQMKAQFPQPHRGWAHPLIQGRVTSQIPQFLVHETPISPDDLIRNWGWWPNTRIRDLCQLRRNKLWKTTLENLFCNSRGLPQHVEATGPRQEHRAPPTALLFDRQWHPGWVSRKGTLPQAGAGSPADPLASSRLTAPSVSSSPSSEEQRAGGKQLHVYTETRAGPKHKV